MRLVAGPGVVPEGRSDEPVSQKAYDDAVAYFEERARLISERSSRVPADGPATPHAPAIQLYHSYPRQRVDDPGMVALRSDYPASLTFTSWCVVHLHAPFSGAMPLR
jgi:hypothetical protein